MPSTDSIATFTRDGKPAALKSLLLVVFFGPIAFFTGERIAGILGTSVPVAQTIGVVVPTGVVVLLAAYFGGSGTVAFHDGRIETKRRTVAYGDVAVAVREEQFSDRLFGTATFRLFIPDGTSLTLRSVNDPDAVGRLLAEHLTVPAQQGSQPSDAGDEGDGPEYITGRQQFWAYWRADEPLPDTAVVTLDDLKRVMGVDALRVDRIDGVDMRDADGLSDIQQTDVTSSSSNPGP
jgi:hypothetical protein